MASIFDLPELLINVLAFVMEDSLSFVRCLGVNKTWREVVIEHAQELLEADVYVHCQATTVQVKSKEESFLEFQVPAYQAQLLIIAGAIEVDRSEFGRVCLLFTSRDVAACWFRTARRYIDKLPQNRPNPLSIIDWDGTERAASFVGGKLMAPILRPKTGQLWFWIWDTRKNNTLAEAKDEMSRAFNSTEPHVVIGAAGLGLVGFDGRDRIWFKLGNSDILHGLGEHEYVTLKVKSRTEVGLPERKERKGTEYFHTGEINGHGDPICALDHENRFYLSDSIGVHIIYADALDHFEYHTPYKINYERNIFYEKCETFYTLHKLVDVTGKLFVWSTPGMCGWSGTVGYWTYDGNAWVNVDLVENIYDISVRIVNNTRQIWLFQARDVKVLEEPLTGQTTPVLIPLKELTGVEVAYNNFIFAQSPDKHETVAYLGSKALLLDSKCNQRQPPTLPDNLCKMIDAVDRGQIGWGNNALTDGVMYFSDDKKIVAASLDGRTVTNFSCTETLSNPRVHWVGMRHRKYGKPVPLIYLKGGYMTYLLDTSVKFVAFCGVPSLYAVNVTPHAPDIQGHVYLRADTVSYQWQANQMPQRLPFKFYNSSFDLIYGTSGLIIEVCSGTQACIYQGDQVIIENNLVTLVDKNYDRLVKFLPWPPNRSSCETTSVTHDGLGNIWMMQRTTLAVRTPEQLIEFDTTKYRSDAKGYVIISAMAPLGNGSAVVLIEKYNSLLVQINQKDQTFNVEPCPNPISVQYSANSFEWKENTFFDRHGEVYLTSEEWNNGMYFKTHQLIKNPQVLGGKLLLIDRHLGKWFYQDRINANKPATLIYRPHKSDAEYSMHLTLKHQIIAEDFLEYHSVWLHVDGGLTRVRFNGLALEVYEELKMALPSRMRAAVSNDRHVLWVGSYRSCGCLVLDEEHFK